MQQSWHVVDESQSDCTAVVVHQHLKMLPSLQKLWQMRLLFSLLSTVDFSVKLLRQWFCCRRAPAITTTARTAPSASWHTRSPSAAASPALLDRSARSSSQSTSSGKILMWSCRQPKFALRQTFPSRYVMQRTSIANPVLFYIYTYVCIFILKEQGLSAKMLTKSQLRASWLL